MGPESHHSKIVFQPGPPSSSGDNKEGINLQEAEELIFRRPQGVNRSWGREEVRP